MEFLKDISQFVWERKKFLFIPLLILLVLLGLLMFATGNPYIAPFIYSLF